MNAVMLSLAFAVTGGNIDRECLGYQGRAISYIRKKMSSPDDATSESTIGAILLLAGVGVCTPFLLSHVSSYVKLVVVYPGSRWHGVSGSTSHGGSATAA
jgi:hypothetical protein